MILSKIQHYLSIAFFSALVITQGLVFVAVKAANDDALLQAIFIEPISENIDIGDNIYFQAMLSNKDDSNFDFVYFNLQNLESGLNESYQASLQDDGTWRAQSVWNSAEYLPGQYYLSAKSYIYQDSRVDIYSSDYKLINLTGEISAQQVTSEPGQAMGFFSSPVENIEIDPTTDPNLEVKFHIEDSVSNTVVESLQFNIIGPIDPDNPLGASYSRFAADILTTENGYVIWKNAGTVNLLGMEDGNYKIIPDVVLNSNVNSDNYDFLSIESFFSIKSSVLATDPVPLDPSSVDIETPLNGDVIIGDQIDISVVLDQDLPEGQLVVAKIIYRGTDISLEDRLFTLLNRTGNPLAYGTTIILPDTVPASGNDGINTGDLWPNGNYGIDIELVNSDSTLGNIVLGQTNISLDRDVVSEPAHEIVLNSPVSGSIIRGDNLPLNFSTNFQANNFNFSLVRNGDSTIAVERFIPPTADGMSWYFNISASTYSLTNGDYILSANTKDINGVLEDFGPITFTWYISEEDSAPSSETVSLRAYQPPSGQIGPGDVLIASSNILGVDFILQSTGDSNLRYTLDYTTIDCANTSILNTAIREEATLLGHMHCFYYFLPSDSIEEISNGNYNFFIQHTDANVEASSDSVLLSYFKEVDINNPTSDGDFIFYGLSSIVNTGGDFNLLFGSDLDLPTGIDVELKDIDSDRSFSFVADKISWADMEAFGITEVDNPDVPFVYASQAITPDIIPSGVYNVSIVGRQGAISQLSIENPADNQEDNSDAENDNDEDNANTPVDNSDAEDNNTDDTNTNDEVVDNTENNNNSYNTNEERVNTNYSPTISTNNIGISYYSTCLEQGISNDETCKRFRALMDSLDETCIDQGIYEAVSCEDYLYRISIDAECQQNNIIDREECKNYLLEKYSGQVDCKLADANLCNSVLRNEYINRLAVGQKLGDNINKAVEPLLGQNISMKDLDKALKDGGVDTQVLPLVSKDDTRILLARAQKETVLEETDQLTILNQAVIILDADGDGLSDDLEKYYDTDINNPDTDGDGYPDGLEVTNGYNPSGLGVLTKDRTAFDRLTLDKVVSIEQPKVKSGKIDRRMKVDNVEALKDQFKLQGKADANTWVNIYIYSGLPLVMTTKTDASGNWAYDIKNSLTDGHHQVFVTINDDTGKIVKQSQPVSFLIREAQAVTADNYFDVNYSVDSPDNIFIYYILGGVFLVFLALGAIILIHKDRGPHSIK